MTQDEIDIMWQQAMKESIKDGEMYTRYHFAEMVAEAEREACAKECWKQMGLLPTQAWSVNPYEQCIDAIRARKQA
jgi:hypothetical protein